MFYVGPVLVTRDGRFWAYSVNRTTLSELWQLTGLASQSNRAGCGARQFSYAAASMPPSVVSSSPSTSSRTRSTRASSRSSAASRPTPSSASSRVMWSEHCSYKSSRVHLKPLPDEGPARHPGPGRERRRRRHRRRLRGRLQDGVAQPPVVHRALPGRGDRRRRHPARRLHDGRAADRVARTRCASASPTSRARRDLLRGVVAGIGGYGNCIGVPTVGGEMHVRPGYDGNILVNASTSASSRTDRIFYGRAAGVGNPILYVGREDRTRRHPRRDDGVRRVRRRRGAARSARRCRSATRSWRSSSSRRASRSSRRTPSSASRTWAPPGSRRRRSRWRAAPATGIELDLSKVPRARDAG